MFSSSSRLFVLALVSLLATSVTFADEGGDPIPIAHRHLIESKILGETRPYLVHKPPKYDYRERAYPLLILLDGDTNIGHTAASVDFLAENGRVPEMLVVGIPNTNRTRDLTPAPRKPDTNLPSAGGASKFLAFIGDELIPEIERRYRTRPYRVIVGHSLGGLFALHALNERPALFNAYLAISPSLWYDDHAIVQRTLSMLAAKPDLRADLYMTLGDERGGMLSGFHALSAGFAEANAKNFRWQAKRSPEETHGSIPFHSTYDGLQMLFDGWYIADAMKMYEQAGLAAIERHYAQLSQRMGFEVRVPLRPFITLHRALEEQRRMDEAVRVVERAMELHAEDAPGHFELARLYVARKDHARAVQSLRRALDLNPGMQRARTMLAELKADVPADAKVPLAAQLLMTGDYVGPEDRLTISTRDGQLFARNLASGMSCELRPLSHEHYYCVDKDIELVVERDRRNDIIRLHEQHPDYRIIRRKAL